MKGIAHRTHLLTTFGTTLSMLVAGDRQRPALLLLHGFPSSANTFRDVIPLLSESCYVIAPDLPGFGQSHPLPATSFDNYTKVISDMLEQMNVASLFIYLHDFGAPIGLRLAMKAPHRVLGLIIQNANAHHTGFGPQWKDTIAFWSDPNPKNEAAATAHLTLEGMRDQYIAGLPSDIAVRVSPTVWEEDWRVMSLPGRREVQRSLIADYASHVKQFDSISNYLKTFQPPALMLWGRHDVFFNIAEVVSWMEDLPRMEAHIFDAGHLMLETHAGQASELMKRFVEKK